MSKQEKAMDIEQALAALKEAVEALENPSLKLEEHIKIYEKASELALFCHTKLSDAKLRITDIDDRLAQLKQNDADGISED